MAEHDEDRLARAHRLAEVDEVAGGDMTETARSAEASTVLPFTVAARTTRVSSSHSVSAQGAEAAARGRTRRGTREGARGETPRGGAADRRLREATTGVS